MAISERYVEVIPVWVNATAYTTTPLSLCVGTDNNAYYCISAHTSETGVKGKPITGTAWDTYWAICDGTSTKPWTLTQAFATAVAADRVNVKAGTYTRTGSDTPTNDGTAQNPIIWRGYNSSIGDLEAHPAKLSQWRTNDNGALVSTNFPVLAYDATYVLNPNGANCSIFQCLKITGARSGYVVQLGSDSSMQQCVIENSSTNSAAIVITMGGDGGSLIVCDLSHTGASGSTCVVNNANSNITMHGCRLTGKGAGFITGAGGGSVITSNLFYNIGLSAISCTYSSATSALRVIGNTFYGCGAGAGTNAGIMLANYAMTKPAIIVDNMITDTTGYGIDGAYKGTAEVPAILCFNRYRDNSNGNIDGLDFWVEARHGGIVAVDGDETSATDYADVGALDFELLVTSPGAKRSATPYKDIGAIQHADPAGGGGRPEIRGGNL